MTKQSKKSDNYQLIDGSGIPEFKCITADRIKEDIPKLLNIVIVNFQDLEKNITEKLENNNNLRWQDVMMPLQNINERLRWSWGAISHLNGVCNSQELRSAYSLLQPEIVRCTNRLSQSKIIYNALLSLINNIDDSLDDTQKRIINIEISSMRLRGVGLEGSIKIEFNNDSERLAELSTLFSNNLLDATKEWSLLLTKKEQVKGLPSGILERLTIGAEEQNERINLEKKDEYISVNKSQGPWELGLDMPRYIPYMTYGEDREIRETLYKAFVSRASKGKINNQELIEEILSLRNKQANRLGYKNWAEVSLATKMADNIKEVEDLLEELRLAALPVAKLELKKLQEIADKTLKENSYKLNHWDIAYWSEKLKQSEFDLDQEKLKPWFPLNKVLNGLFNLCERLFNISIKQENGYIPKWHKDVLFFRVFDNDNSEIAGFFLDPYSRPSNKRGGAWMDECINKETTNNGKNVLPIAYLICNQTPPSGSKPSLMSFDEVQTLFHEFGHGLQHMLTTVKYPQAAGINNVEWDAVELPSQFMENWCLDRKTLMGMAQHWKTNEQLPEEEFEKLKRAKTFNTGLSTLRQVNLALTDIRLHSSWTKECGQTPDEMRREICNNSSLINPISEDQFLCSFGHIFSGGYSAGYYSYKWAEVLSSDAYEAFEELNIEDEEAIKKTGLRFRKTILSLGGSMSPKVIYKKFRGRTSNTKALIRHSGLG